MEIVSCVKACQNESKTTQMHHTYIWVTPHTLTALSVLYREIFLTANIFHPSVPSELSDWQLPGPSQQKVCPLHNAVLSTLPAIKHYSISKRV